MDLNIKTLGLGALVFGLFLVLVHPFMVQANVGILAQELALGLAVLMGLIVGLVLVQSDEVQLAVVSALGIGLAGGIPLALLPVGGSVFEVIATGLITLAAPIGFIAGLKGLLLFLND